MGIVLYVEEYPHSRMKIFALHVEIVDSVVVSAVEGVVFVDSVPCASSWLPLARIVSTLCSTFDNHLAYSSTSSMAECRPLWVYSLTAAEAPETC